MAEDEATERRNAEIELLQAMYPDEISVNDRTSELKYQEASGTLLLRLASDYPSATKPTVLSAQSRTNNHDVREQIREYIATLDAGEELLDLIITAFKDIAPAQVAPASTTDSTHIASDTAHYDGPATIIIWLHHLLATSKRKLALHPTSSSSISGITKPGYPGVMIFSGPASAVRDHVGELRSMNWQAFQVRYEEDVEWVFGHGKGIKEVESMGEVVDAVGERREELMGVLKIK